MRTGATKPEWDTPPDGDFASYVERLTAESAAAASHAKARSSSTQAGPSSVARGPRPARQGAFSSSSSSEQTVFAPGWAPFDAGLRAVRLVVLGLTGLHALALTMFGQGSLVGLIAMAALWWGLGALRTAGRKAMDLAAQGQPPLTLHDVQERLRALAAQRAAGTGMPKHRRNVERKNP